ncbi:aldehyde dehydrogenase (plasmid) [Escherichia coli]|nr:aldehyde dehydrogenase [Escherichia coli]
MATTVIAAFNEFMKDTVNLKKADTDDARAGNDSNLLIVFYVQIMPDDFVMQLHRF